MRTLRSGCIVLALAIAGCLAPRGVEYLPGGTTPDGLERIRSWNVWGAFARRDARLEDYSRIRFELATIAYREPPRYPRGRRVPAIGAAQSVELSEEDEARIGRYFEEVFRREFGTHSALEPTDEPGVGTLTVRAHVLDLVVERTGQPPGAVSAFSNRAPVFTLVLDVRDSITDEPLTRIVDRRAVSRRNGVAHRIDATVDPGGLRRAFLQWARVLRKQIDRLAA